MDSRDYALLSTLGFDIVIFGMLFILFLIYRQYRSKHIYSNNPNIIPKNAVFSESDNSLKILLIKVWNTSLYDIYDKCGLEAYMYMAVHIQIIIGLAVMCFFGVIVLVPIYAQGDQTEGSIILKTGISNVLDNENYLVASIVFFVFFSILGYSLVYIVLKTVSIKAHPHNVRNFNYVLEISGFPRQEAIDKIYDKIFYTLQKEFADECLGLYVVPNLAQSYIAHKNLLDAEEKLEHYKKYQESHHSRKEIRTGIFKTQDAIEYYESLVKKFQKDYKDNLKEKRIGNSGFAYATFRTTESAARAKRHLMEMKKILNWVVRTAPAPEEIKWENMEEDYEVLKWQRWLLMVFFVILFFVLITPAGFLYLVKEGLSSFNGEQIVHGLFKDNFPTLVLLFFQAVIVNYSVRYIVQKEQRVHLSVETTSRLVKYLLFMGFYIFLLQALGSQTLIQLTLEGFWGSWGMRLPIAITQTGAFFTIFIINQAFLANGFDLLQPIIIIVTKFRLSVAETEKEKLLAQEALPFDFAYEFALSLNSLLIILCYSIVFPIIMIFGLIHFTFKFFVHKYLILCVNYTNRTSTGISMPRVCLTSIATSLFVFQFLTGLIFAANSSSSIRETGGILIFISAVLYIFLVYNIHRVLKKAMSWINVFPNSEEYMLRSSFIEYDENLYIHPIEKKLKESVRS